MNDTGPNRKPGKAKAADRADPICCKNNRQFDRVNKTIFRLRETL
jgi:hypothetical protein